MPDPTPDQAEAAADLPVGAVDASGEPMPVAGVVPPTMPAMIDDDGVGEVNGELTGEPGDG